MRALFRISALLVLTVKEEEITRPSACEEDLGICTFCRSFQGLHLNCYSPQIVSL